MREYDEPYDDELFPVSATAVYDVESGRLCVAINWDGAEEGTEHWMSLEEGRAFLAMFKEADEVFWSPGEINFQVKREKRPRTNASLLREAEEADDDDEEVELGGDEAKKEGGK